MLSILPAGGLPDALASFVSSLWPASVVHSSAASRPDSSPTQRVLRAAIRALRPTGLLDRQEHARVRVPQIHAGHRAGQWQIRIGHGVLITGVGLQKFGA